MTAPGGVHFCGSIRLADDLEDGIDSIRLENDPANHPEGDKSAEKVMRHVCTALPDRLLRLSDGEAGSRRLYCGWQIPVLYETPWIMRDFSLVLAGKNPADYSTVGKVEDIKLGEVKYDVVALQSYKAFAKLKKEGVIHRDTRFQVCLPSPLNPTILHVKDEYTKHVEPMYEEAILQAVKNIQAQIPHEELAFQWDCVIELCWLEGVMEPFPPHFEVSIDSVAERWARLALAVDDDVEMGFHLCYGDWDHRHFMDPKDTKLMVNLTNAFSKTISRPINWVHMPVPIQRKDDAYFAPLRDLHIHPETEIYLGLIHANDLDGTKERISTALHTVPGLKFGVATECGLGRTPTTDINSIMEISKAVATPVLAGA